MGSTKHKTTAKAKVGKMEKPKPAAGKVKDTRLIKQVIKRQESITRKDISDWKRARQQATSTSEPKQVLLQRLYDEIMLDALMTSQVSVLRIGKSQGADFALMVKGKKDDEATQVLKDSGLYEDLVELILESIFYGDSVVEFAYGNVGLEADLIPRVNISPEVGKFYPDPAGIESVNYRELPDFGKWIVEFYPRKRDLGLLNKAVPYVLIKKFAMSCWSELCEIYGIPPRVMKTNTTDPGMLQQAEMMMKEIGSAAYFIIDTTEEFEFAESVNTNGDVFRNLISTCDQQISLLNLAAVLGQDTINGNRSKEESSSQLLEAVVKADRRLVQSTFNKIILPALASIGFLKPGLRLEVVKEVDIEKFWKMVCEAADRWDVDPAWVKETFGIAIIGKKSYNVQPPAEGNDVEERLVFLDAPRDGALSSGSLSTEFDGALIQRVADGQSTYWDAELFRFFSSDLLNAIRTSFKSVLNSLKQDVVYDAPDDAYAAAMEQNLFHFSAAKTLSEVQELNQAFRESKSPADFRQRAADITSAFNRMWQETEYRTAVQVAEQASAYRSLKANEQLFPVWVYRTVGDNQVRPEHAALDGTELPSNDPAWSKIYPPNDWGCRCYVDALMADEHEGGFEQEREKVREFMDSSEWKKSEAQGWGVNRAETAEVFTANQMYIKKFPDKAASLVGKLHYNDYGLDSFGKRLGQATQAFKEFKGDPARWYAGNGQFKDFSGKTIELSRQVFESHTTGKYMAKRVPLLDCIGDVLKNPDEVWMNDYKKAFNNYNYIKFYQGKAVNVICNIEKNKLQVNTWFEIEQSPRLKKTGKPSRQIDPRWRYRRGLLIKK